MRLTAIFGKLFTLVDERVFPGATNYVCLLFLEKQSCASFKGTARFMEDVRGRLAALRGQWEESAWNGPSYFITNETAVATKPH